MDQTLRTHGGNERELRASDCRAILLRCAHLSLKHDASPDQISAAFHSES